mgnify:CR=1 FL=1
MSDQAKALIGLMVVFLSAGAGFLLGDHMAGRDQVAQLPAAEERTAPNDVALRTEPKAKPKLPAPTHSRGGKILSVTELQVDGGKPTINTEPHTGCLTAADFECPNTLLRLDLMQLRDGQQYMAVRGDNDREITGRLIPMADVLVPRRNRAAIDRYADGSTVIRYERRVLKRFWLGPAAMIQPAGDTSLGATVGGEW